MGEIILRDNIDQDETKASLIVLSEIVSILNQYKDHFIVIGGWVPFLLFQDADPPHIGSLDVDLAFNPVDFPDDFYSSIKEVLATNGYIESEDNLFTFIKKVTLKNGKSYKVKVDLLADEIGLAKKKRHHELQGLHFRRVAGVSFALSTCVVMSFESILPDGYKDVVKVPITSPAGYIVQKSRALERRKPKDSLDIYFVLDKCRDSLQDISLSLAKANAEYRDEINISIELLSKKFESIEHTGPNHIADFMGLSGEERLPIIQDSFVLVRELIEKYYKYKEEND